MILQVESLTKRFGGLIAVDEVSFNVDKGEIFGIIGPNGAGKSTLLGVISGFLPPDGGKAVFEGQDITGFPPHRVAQTGIGRQFQASSLFMDLSCIENVFVGFHMAYKTGNAQRFLHFPSANKEQQEFKQRAAQILEFMGLGSLQNELAKNLPYGHQRILGMCIAMATSPRLLMLDEPVTGMNAVEIATVVDLVRRVRDSGTTIMVIEHHMETMMNLCDRMLVLNFGRKIAEGLPGDIQQNEEVIEAYLGKEVIE